MSSLFDTSIVDVATFSYEDSSSDEENYWESFDWIPRTKSGVQKTPNAIRNELQRYIDSSPRTQKSIIEELGVTYNSFRKFMNPKAYKDQWSAVQNGTYWAAARFLEKESVRKKKDAKMRKATTSCEDARAAKKTKAEEKLELKRLLANVNDIYAPEVSETLVFDSCPVLVKKIKDILAKGVSKRDLCKALGGINHNSINKFLAGKKQDQCGNITYRRAWVFFEKMRLSENGPKTQHRIKNEREHPGGFSTSGRRSRSDTRKKDLFYF